MLLKNTCNAWTLIHFLLNTLVKLLEAHITFSIMIFFFYTMVTRSSYK